MPWIDRDHPVHHCVQPQWQEGDLPRHNYDLWACEDCGTVYFLILGRFKGMNDEKWRPSYGWTKVSDEIYIPPKG